MKSQNYNPNGIMKMQWCHSQNWSAEVYGHKLFESDC